jgi:hypothetical protein
MRKEQLRVVISPTRPGETATPTNATRVFLGDVEISHIIEVKLVAHPNALWEAQITGMCQIVQGEDDG